MLHWVLGGVITFQRDHGSHTQITKPHMTKICVVSCPCMLVYFKCKSRKKQFLTVFVVVMLPILFNCWGHPFRNMVVLGNIWIVSSCNHI